MGDIEFFDGSVGMYTLSLLPKEENDPLWGSGLIVSNPKVVKQMHREYINAGSTVVSSCTYQASLDLYCKQFKLTRNAARDKLANGVTIARECFEESEVNGKNGEKCDECPKFKVAASIGSFGAHLCDMSEYDGSFAKKFSIEEMKVWHREMVESFIKTSPDLLGFETVPVMKEMQAIMSLMSESFPEKKFYISFACSSPTTLGSGELFQNAVKEIVSLKGRCNLAAIGINCSAVHFTTPLLQSAKEEIQQLGLPILIMPNLRFGGFSPEEFAEIHSNFFACVEKEVETWYSLGVRWFGLCCRTTPADIKKLKQMVTAKIGSQQKL